jgi:ribosomal protein L20
MRKLLLIISIILSLSVFAQEDKTVSRHLIKRNSRRLWIMRLNGFARQNNITYNILLKEINSSSPFQFNRKILAHLVYYSPEIVKKILDKSIYVNI